MSFTDRCAQPGVVKCVGFDTASDFNTGTGGTNGAPPLPFGIVPPYGTSDYTRATQDASVKASGNSSLRFTIPAKSSADVSGSWYTNFSNDLSVQFGENTEFYIQWRQRFSSEFLSNAYAATDGGGGGWKQVILGTGDVAGSFAWSCTALETVLVNNYRRGFPQMYNSCTGSTSHGAYDPFEQAFGGDIMLQNGRPSPYCLYSQGSTSYFPPIGNCFGYFANEWMTFQIHIKLGPRVNDEFVNSMVTLSMAREGKASEPVINWGPYNLTAGPSGENQRFGKIWLLPYITAKDPTVSYPVAYTWYDELIISRNPIPDP